MISTPSPSVPATHTSAELDMALQKHFQQYARQNVPLPVQYIGMPNTLTQPSNAEEAIRPPGEHALVIANGGSKTGSLKRGSNTKGQYCNSPRALGGDAVPWFSHRFVPDHFFFCSRELFSKPDNRFHCFSKPEITFSTNSQTGNHGSHRRISGPFWAFKSVYNHWYRSSIPMIIVRFTHPQIPTCVHLV